MSATTTPRKRRPAAPAKTNEPFIAADAPSATIKVGDKQVSLSNLQKVLYPATGFTKGDVINYYAGISKVLLKHIKERTVTLKRYPNGAEGMFFYEKNCPSHRPSWVDTANVPTANRIGGINYCLIENKASLIWTAQLASLELHTSLSRARDVKQPTMMVFDLDPGPPASLLDCIPVALRMRDTLARIGLRSFPKTSGGKGLHFYVPLNTPCTFDDTKAFARTLAELLEHKDPKHVISVMKKDLRTGKIFIDWSQNDEHKTTVCAYSLRAREHPTVSTPVTWEELEGALAKKDASGLIFEAHDVLRRVEELGDLFAPVLTLKQRLPAL